jgi:tRNA threonylcarbamoyladenosine biosynthesis protein TsaB
MKVLAIDTSTMLGGIAVCDDSAGMIAEVRLNVKSTHSERLMAETDHILKQSSLSISDMDAFAIAIGPGSFTGLRIGLSTVKGLSYATGRPIVAVPTLEAFAWNFPFSRYPVCTLLDARRKEVYAAIFRWETDGFVRVVDETAVGIKTLLKGIKVGNPSSHRCDKERDRGPLYEAIIFAGEGAILYKDEIIEEMEGGALFASPEKMVPSPANVASLGITRALRGEFSEPVSLVPWYLRKSEAEMKWNG